MHSNTEADFSNSPVSGAAIPDYTEVEFERLAENFRRYTLVSTLSALVPFMAAAPLAWLLPFISQALHLWFLGVGVLVLGLLVAVYRWIDAGYRGWALREHDFIACAGVLWRSITALPIARIQHVETSHGPLERAHGLARLKLYTAGGLTADLVIVGLRRATADRLREYLVEEIRKRDSAAAGSDEASQDDEPAS